MTGSSTLRAAELPSYVEDAIARYLAFLATMRAVGCALPGSAAPRFWTARDAGDVVDGHLASGDPRPLPTVLSEELRRLHRTAAVRRRFVPRRWRRLGRAVLTVLNGVRRAAGKDDRAIETLPRLGSLVPPASPRTEDRAFVASFAAFLDRQPREPDFAALAAFARLLRPSGEAGERFERIARDLIDGPPRRLALVADALLAGDEFGPLRPALARQAARALALAGQDAIARALDVPEATADALAVRRQSDVERTSHHVDLLAPLFARQGAEIAWDGALSPAALVDFSAARPSPVNPVSVTLDARFAPAGAAGLTLASLLAQSHKTVEILVVQAPGEPPIAGSADKRVRVLASASRAPAATIWNAASRSARGDLIAVAEAGAFWLANALATLVVAHARSRGPAIRSSAILMRAEGAGRLDLVPTGIVCLDRVQLHAAGGFDAAAEAPLEELIGRMVTTHGPSALVQLDDVLAVGNAPSPVATERDRVSWAARQLEAMRLGVPAPPPEAGSPLALDELAPPPPEELDATAPPLAKILRLESARDWCGVVAATQGGIAAATTAAGLRAALARSDALRSLGRGEQALATLVESEARHGASHHTRERAAALHAMFGAHEAALDALVEAIAALPSAADHAAYRALARRRAEALLRLDRLEEARDAIHALIAAGPPNHAELATLGRTVRTRADLDRFEETLAPFIARADARARTALHNLAAAARDIGLHERAIAAARQRLLHAFENAAAGTRSPEERVDWSADAVIALADAIADLGAIDLQPFLVSGTLLGHVREGGVIGHDKDIDLGVFTMLPADAIRAALARHGRFLPRLGTSDRFVQVIHANGVVIDVFLHWQVGDIVYHQGVKTRWRNRAFDLEPASFLGSQVLVPVQAERYLVENYGPAWRTPEPDFETFVDTPNMEVEDEGHMIWYLLTRLHDYHVAAKPLQFRRVWEALAPRLAGDREIEACVTRILAAIP